MKNVLILLLGILFAFDSYGQGLARTTRTTDAGNGNIKIFCVKQGDILVAGTTISLNVPLDDLPCDIYVGITNLDNGEITYYNLEDEGFFYYSANDSLGTVNEATNIPFNYKLTFEVDFDCDSEVFPTFSSSLYCLNEEGEMQFFDICEYLISTQGDFTGQMNCYNTILIETQNCCEDDPTITNNDTLFIDPFAPYTGKQEKSKSRSIISYNQSTSEIVLHENVKEILIIDIFGNVLMDNNKNNTNSINLETMNIPTGIYIISSIDVNGNVQSRKIFKP